MVKFSWGFLTKLGLYEHSISTMQSSGYFTRIYKDVIGVNLKFLKKKVKRAIAM